jgi:ketopantoate hydroxymethyltransferase
MTPMAKLLDPHVDLLLVGDSLGMALYGFSSTLHTARHVRHDDRAGRASARPSNSARGPLLCCARLPPP